MKIILDLENYQILNKFYLKIHAKGHALFNQSFNSIIDYLNINIKTHGFTIDILIKLISQLDGFFSIVIENDNYIFLITDKVSSFPLFYLLESKKIKISDQISKIGLNIDNRDGVEEFLHGGSVTGNSTLSKEIKSVNPATILKISKNNNKTNIYSYYRYGHFPKKIFDKKEFKISFNDILFNSFRRLKKYINTNKFIPVVPLSGGIDSRLIALMLNKVGVKNVICYTFGNHEHQEVKISKDVAKRLNFEWRFMPYNQSTWSEDYNDSNELLKYVGNNKSIPNIMESFAVEKLFEKDKNYLFIPGHTLDVISGSHYSDNLIENSGNIETVYECILRQHFNLFSMNPKIRNKIKGKIAKECRNLNGFDCFDFYDWKQRQSTFIMNTLRVYQFYGYNWHIPYWEKDFISLFSQIPSIHKYKRNLCLNTLGELFPDYFDKHNYIKPSTNKFINALKGKFFYLLKNYIEYYFFIFFKKRLQMSINQDYGLNRFGAFESKSKNLKEFNNKYASKTKAKSIFYFFAKDYLKKNKK